MAMCRSVPALACVALRAPFGPLLEPFWDLQKMRWAEELRYWDPEHWRQASSTSKPIHATTFEVSEARYSTVNAHALRSGTVVYT
jgi:hypothetical protein